MEHKTNWKEIVRWILTVISAILAGLGAESCISSGSLDTIQNDVANLLTTTLL